MRRVSLSFNGRTRAIEMEGNREKCRFGILLHRAIQEGGGRVGRRDTGGK